MLNKSLPTSVVFALCLLVYAVVAFDSYHNKLEWNRLHISYDDIEHDGWLPGDCDAYKVTDEPKGCSLQRPYALNKSRTVCTRACNNLNHDQAMFLNKLQPSIEIKVWVHGSSKSEAIKCHLKWNPYMHLHGYDLQIEYLWMNRLWTASDYIQLLKCEAHPIQSMKPIHEGDNFVISRRLFMAHRVTASEQLASIGILLIAVLLIACCCAGVVTFMCLAMCKCRRRRQKRISKRFNQKDQKKPTSIYPNAFEQGPAESDLQPMYIPYYSLNPYSVPIPLQPGVDQSQEGPRFEQTYQIPIFAAKMEVDGQ